MVRLSEHFDKTGLGDILSSSNVSSIVPGSENARYGLIKRAIASGDILHLRKGLYCLGEKYQRRPVNLWEVAQRIYGPSYISLESALSYHGWIPEAVYTVTSACVGRAKYFRTPIGDFVYKRIPVRTFYEDVERIVADERTSFMMARPFKALLDYIYVYKKDWKSLRPVLDSLRVDEECLKKVSSREMRRSLKAYPFFRVQGFIKGVMKEIGYER